MLKLQKIRTGSSLLQIIQFVDIGLLLILAVAPVPLSAQNVVPPALSDMEGNGENIFPFNCIGGQPSMRYQQIYEGSSVGSGLIEEIRFRQDGSLGAGFGVTTTEDVIIQLSTTPADAFGAAGGLSETFEENIGADVVTVYSGDLELSSSSSTDVPRPFDIIIRLQGIFIFEPVVGSNLLLDITIPMCWASTWFDAEDTIDDAVSRAVAPDSTSATAAFTDTKGLVTQFVVTPSEDLIFADGFESGNAMAWH